MQAAKTALEAQLLLVVAQNPWVCVILAKGKDGTTCLRFPTTPTEADVKKMVKVDYDEKVEIQPAYYEVSINKLPFCRILFGHGF